MEYFLFNSYKGRTEHVAETKEELINYIREKNNKADLMGEGAYDIFYGRHLSTAPFWYAALQKPKTVNSG